MNTSDEKDGQQWHESDYDEFDEKGDEPVHGTDSNSNRRGIVSNEESTSLDDSE